MVERNDLYRWCSVPADKLLDHPDRRVPLRIVEDGATLGQLMARDLADEIIKANNEKRIFRLIVPCGPKEWYGPFAEIVNKEIISLNNVVCYHMDENLDWEAKLLPENDPNNFRTFMHRYFYETVNPVLRVKEDNRNYITNENVFEISRQILQTKIDYTIGGWGQDGHIAFNQTRRNPYSQITIDDLRNSTARIQDNNYDTLLALSQRGMGGAWQFIPSMSVTLGIKECFKAKKIRVYSATGAWKQTALRVALFSEPDVEYPITLLQEHPDALITATYETACHPISEHPEWEFRGVKK